MEQLSTLITQFIISCDDPNRSFGQEYATQISELITQDQIKLLEFIQALGAKITSDDDGTRSQSINCLSSTLQQLPRHKLSKQDINVMVDFFVSKFDDKPSIKYVLHSLSTLITFNNFNCNLNNNYLKIINKLVDDYDTSKHLAKIRYETFRIIENFLTNHIEKIIHDKNYSTLLIKSFIHISTGEKDPRNLLLSFNLCELINQSFKFDVDDETDKYFINELLDNTFCYFPISFKPPPNDPYKITPQQLKLNLRNALTSQDLFAKELLSSLLEKLTSTNPAIRNDVLLTMLQCVEKFNANTLLTYWDVIWNGLKFEILHLDNLNGFNPTNGYLVPQDLVTMDDNNENKSVYLTLVILNLLIDKINNESITESITLDLKEYLVISSKYFKNCILLLSSLSSVSIVSFNFFTKFLFSHEILGKFINPESQNEITDDEEDVAITVNKQRDLIDSFGFILTSYQVVFSNVTKEESSLASSNNELFKHKDNLIIFMGQLLQVSSNIEKTLKIKIIQQYFKLIQLPFFLTFEEKKSIVEILNEMFINLLTNPKDILFNSIIEGLIQLIKQNSKDELIIKLISQVFLPNLLIKIEEKNLEILNIFEKIIINYELLEIISIRLINKLDNDSNYNFKIIELIIKLIYKIENSQQFLMNSWFKFIPIINKQILKDEENIEIYSELIGIIIKYNDVSKHQDIINQFKSIFYESKSDLNLPGYDLLNKPNKAIVIFNKVLSNIDKNVEFVFNDSQLDNLINIVPNTFKVEYLLHLSLIVNKFFNNIQYFENFNVDYTNLTKFEIWVWILKSLILKLDKFGILKLNELINDSSKIESSVYLKSFDILLKDLKIYQSNKELPKGSKIISKVNNLNIRLLYKQQIFNIVLNKILEANNDENDGQVFLNLNLLSVLTKNIDTNILRLRINEILPLVIKSLKFNNLLESSLNNLLIIIESGNGLIDNLPFLIKRLIEISNSKIKLGNKIINDEKIRYLALSCLLNLVKINEKESIMIYKTDLLNGLKNSLDDPKRSVRKLTCDIRQELYELR